MIYRCNIRLDMVNKVGRKRLFLVWSCLVSILRGIAQTEKLIDYVNPFVGTDGYGNVYRVRRFLSGNSDESGHG